MIYVECETENILASILSPREKIIHVAGKTRVLKRLEKQENAKGLIDEDPLSPQPPQLKKYQVVDEQLEVKIFSREGNRKLIVLCPRLEEWILKAAKELKINLKNYGLQENPNLFHEAVSLNPRKFERLIKDMQEKSVRLKKLAKFLKNKNST